MTRTATFRELLASQNKAADHLDVRSALGEWYECVCDTPIAELQDADISRACRQQLFPSHVVPEAIERLKRNPFSGDIYEGELLVALKSIPSKYWCGSQSQAMAVIGIAQLVAHDCNDDDLRRDVEGLLELINPK